MHSSFAPILLALGVSISASCAYDSQAAEAAAPPTVDLESAVVVARGSFSGMNDHVVTGTVQIVELGGQSFLRLQDSFTLDGAPDPKVGFGTSGTYDQASTVSPLRATTGAQDYVLPASFSLDTLNEAYIWCDQFSVGLGVARLTR